VSKYLSLAREGFVEKMECPLDQGLLFANTDLSDNIFLYCLSCNYKKHIGINMYNDMKRAVDGK
jgi:hypothetical protein